MSITVEELKGLNVEKYIDWLIETVDNMEYARIMISHNAEQLRKIMLNKIKWELYYNSKQQKTNKWHQRYNELSNSRLLKLEQEINTLDNNLSFTCVLASSESNLKIIAEKKEDLNNHTDLKEELYKVRDEFSPEKFKQFLDITVKICNQSKETFSYKLAETIDFTEIKANIYHFKKIFQSHLEYHLSNFERMQKINANATQTILKEATNAKFKFIDFIQNATFCREFFYNMEVVDEFSTIAYYSHVAKEDIEPSQYITNEKQLTHPQKIVLLDKLGFFKLEKLTHLTNRQKEKIISMLINEDETNTRRYINGIASKEKAGNYNPYKNSINEDVINKLLS